MPYSLPSLLAAWRARAPAAALSPRRRPAMNGRTRRDFFADVGRGMLLAGVGSSLATDLGFTTARAAEGPDRLTFGHREPLVGMLQDTPADKLLPVLVRMLHDGA